MATHLPHESKFVLDLDGAVIILKDAAVETAQGRDRVAKRARDGDLPLLKEGDACGWSSAVLERGLALRRRRGPSSCSRRGCGWVIGAASAAAATAEADEQNCCVEESMTSGAVAAKAAAQRETDNSYLACISLNPIYY